MQVTITFASYAFISPLSSTMIAPALDVIAKAFHIGSAVESQISLSIFVLAYALGPLFLGPLSEIFGRALVLQLSALWYLAFNIGCGFCTSKSQLIAFRFLSGLGGSAPLAVSLSSLTDDVAMAKDCQVGGGILADCWKPEERGRALSIYSLAPLLGPVIGPIAGGFITEYTTWRWVFWSSSIAAGVIQAFGFIIFAETYPPILLQWKAQRLRTETGNQDLHTPFETPENSMANTLMNGFMRPLRLIGTQIVVQIMGLYMAYIYGTLYLVLATFPVLWEGQYHESTGIGTLNYISIGLGFFVGAYSCALLQDRVYSALKKRHNVIGRPEFRIPLMVPGSLLMPIGLFWYGWSAQAHVHWIVPNIGAFFIGAGVIIGFQCIQTFLVDTYTRYAASAIGAATVLRSLCGFSFPIFAPAMYDKLGYGWGNSLLAFMAIFLGVPGPLLLWKYGEILRAKSPFAAGDGHH